MWTQPHARAARLHAILNAYLSGTFADLLGIDNVREVLDVLWDYRAKWRFIGLELEIKPGDLDAMGANNRTVEDALLEVIKLWLHRANPKPTRTFLSAVTRSKLLVTEEESLPLAEAEVRAKLLVAEAEVRAKLLITQAESQRVTQVVSTREGCVGSMFCT